MSNERGRSASNSFAILRHVFKAPLPWLAIRVGAFLVGVGRAGQSVRGVGLRLQAWGERKLDAVADEIAKL